MKHGIHLDYRKTFLLISALESLQIPYQGIHPYVTPNAAGEGPALTSTSPSTRPSAPESGDTLKALAGYGSI